MIGLVSKNIKINPEMMSKVDKTIQEMLIIHTQSEIDILKYLKSNQIEKDNKKTTINKKTNLSEGITTLLKQYPLLMD